MNIDIGSLFEDAFAMFKQRFWGMLGLWATFIGMIVALFIVFFIFVGASALGVAALSGGEAAFDGAGGLGFGVGIIASTVIFYLLMLAMLFAQQGSMMAMASPIERVNFGEAIARGFKGGLTLTVLMIPLLILNIIFGLLATLVTGFAALASPILSVIFAILLIPVGIYFACRFAVLVPVIVVEQIYNPIKAVNRAWVVTRGRVLSILVVVLLVTVCSLVVFGIPFGAAFALSDPSSGGEPPLIVALIPLLMFPLTIVFMIFYVAVTASLHARISDHGAQSAAEVFE